MTGSSAIRSRPRQAGPPRSAELPAKSEEGNRDGDSRPCERCGHRAGHTEACLERACGEHDANGCRNEDRDADEHEEMSSLGRADHHRRDERGQRDQHRHDHGRQAPDRQPALEQRRAKKQNPRQYSAGEEHRSPEAADVVAVVRSVAVRALPRHMTCDEDLSAAEREDDDPDHPRERRDVPVGSRPEVSGREEMEQVVADVRRADCDEDDRAGPEPAHRRFAGRQSLDVDVARAHDDPAPRRRTTRPDTNSSANTKWVSTSPPAVRIPTLADRYRRPPKNAASPITPT